MTQSDCEQKRKAVEFALTATYNLANEVQHYIDEHSLKEDNPPDFLAIAQQLVPGEQQQMEHSLERSSLGQIAEIITTCVQCPLGKLRQHAVPGEGAADASLMVVGEGPGRDEDATGRPFVGRAGKYFDTWLSAIGISREYNVFITNIVKCRPPQNRNPLPEEAHACLPYLKRQIALVKPDAILCLGKVAANYLLETNVALHAMRTTIHRVSNIPVLVTYHPAAVLRNSDLRAPVWEDLKRLAAILNLPLDQGRS